VLDAPANTGLDATITDEGAGEGRFKAPSLRNVAVRGHFMHDGRFTTLEQVVDFYDHGVQPNPSLDLRLRGPDGRPRRLGLSVTDKAALVAFLKTLTDEQLLTDVRYSNPFPR
jgi:cytochrome c peroxidase